MFEFGLREQEPNAKVVHMTNLDEFDLKIVAALQENGRLTNIEVAGMVGLSHSSCSRRISRMEREGIITGYRALTDRLRLGFTVRAFCGVIRHQEVGWEELSRNLADIEGVVSVFVVSGEVDLILEIVTRDMLDYSNVVLHKVLETKGVTAARSSFVLDEIKSLY